MVHRNPLTHWTAGAGRDSFITTPNVTGSTSTLSRSSAKSLLLIVVASLLCPVQAAAQSRSDDYTEPYQRTAFEIYRNIIPMRTVAGEGQVPAMARYLVEQFQAGGFPAEDIHLLPFTSPSGEEIAGLVVRYRGDGSSGRRPILLLAHMDVVDARREDWERDPFTLIEEDGYFFGRGS